MEELRASVIERADEKSGTLLIERLERKMPVSEIPCSPDYKAGCEPCEMRGKNLACPPYSPYIPDYIKGAAFCLAICYRLPLEQIHNAIPDERYWSAYHIVREMLMEELLRWRGNGHLVAGSGPCNGCPECVLVKGETDCRFPERRIYSLESMGVSVVLFSEAAFGLSLDWSGHDSAAETVSALGAVFI